ncbi:hypothetical protein ACFORL_03420 [Legionella dresdenensis]|uniref:Ankyrin repeat protein n=1 Tax=Legionella dresdenensis TaxID=450200 RepID=A0ABV8CCV8_9GAMM
MNFATLKQIIAIYDKSYKTKTDSQFLRVIFGSTVPMEKLRKFVEDNSPTPDTNESHLTFSQEYELGKILYAKEPVPRTEIKEVFDNIKQQLWEGEYCTASYETAQKLYDNDLTLDAHWQAVKKHPQNESRDFAEILCNLPVEIRDNTVLLSEIENTQCKPDIIQNIINELKKDNLLTADILVNVIKYYECSQRHLQTLKLLKQSQILNGQRDKQVLSVVARNIHLLGSSEGVTTIVNSLTQLELDKQLNELELSYLANSTLHFKKAMDAIPMLHAAGMASEMYFAFVFRASEHVKLASLLIMLKNKELLENYFTELNQTKDYWSFIIHIDSLLSMAQEPETDKLVDKLQQIISECKSPRTPQKPIELDAVLVHTFLSPGKISPRKILVPVGSSPSPTSLF